MKNSRIVVKKTGEAISKLNLDHDKDESEQQPREEFSVKYTEKQIVES